MYEIMVIAPDNTQKFYDFETATVTIGRKPGNTLVLAGATVSSKHAKIYMEDEKIVICDLGSTNGTFVNDLKIQEPQVLVEKDIIYIPPYHIKIKRHEVEQAQYEDTTKMFKLSETAKAGQAASAKAAFISEWLHILDNQTPETAEILTNTIKSALELKNINKDRVKKRSKREIAKLWIELVKKNDNYTLEILVDIILEALKLKDYR